ncbi:hypothetical protein [Rhodanobacter lindaniclasticus]
MLATCADATDRGGYRTADRHVRSPELNVPLLVVSPVSAVAPPTAPPKSWDATSVHRQGVRAIHRGAEADHATAAPLASVALAPSVTAPL